MHMTGVLYLEYALKLLDNRMIRIRISSKFECRLRTKLRKHVGQTSATKAVRRLPLAPSR